MPNVKKELLQECMNLMRDRARALDHELWKNRYEIKRLAEKQKDIKKRRAEAHRLAHQLGGK